jgi:cytochrome bd-type quinol oxidase subunit 2
MKSTTFFIAIILFAISYAILVASPVMAQTPSQGANITNPAQGFFIDLTGPGSNNPPCQENSFSCIIEILINIFLGIVGVISVGFLIFGGFQYVTSSGSEEQSKAAKQTIFNAVIGLVVVILAYTIVVVVINALTGQGI